MPGILWGADYDTLQSSVIRVLDRFAWTSRVRFVEIGIHEGKTSRDLMSVINDWFGFRLKDFTYYGIDPFVSRPELGRDFIFLRDLSHLAVVQLPSEIHWCMVDACHCYQCVERDIAFYAPLLVPGGELCLHDASPGAQGRDPQTYPGMEPYHDHDVADQGIAVRKVLDSIMPGRSDFRLIQMAPEMQAFGGVEVYQKVN